MRVERGPVADVGLLEGVAVRAGDAVEVREVGRIGQRVEVDDLVTVGDGLPHHCRADEPGAARHQKPHAFTPYSKGDVHSRNRGVRRSLSERVRPSPGIGPVDADVRVVPAHAAVAAAIVHVVHLVEDQRVVGQSEEPVQETVRHQDLRAVLRRDLLGDPPAVVGRSAPCVHRDVEDRPVGHPHQLGLREGRCLIVQPAQRAGPGRQAFVVLDEAEIEAVVRHAAGAPGFREVSALVAEPARRQDLHVGQGCGADFHARSDRRWPASASSPVSA